MNSISVMIDGVTCSVPIGTKLLEAARKVGAEIPTLCYLKDCNEIAACRMCLVKVEGRRGLFPACETESEDGMKVWTNTPEVLAARKRSLDLICTNHRMDCEYCVRRSDCELHTLVSSYGLDDRKYTGKYADVKIEDSAVHLIRDYSKCVRCRRCVSICQKQGTDNIAVKNRGFELQIGPPIPLAETQCIHCGQCVAVCPVGALKIRDETQKVWNAILAGKHMSAFVSPFASASIGELFNESLGKKCEGKLITALRSMGFEKVFALEEYIYEDVGSSFALSPRCPAFVNYCKNYFPMLEKYFMNKKGNFPQKSDNDFYVVIGPCTAEKGRTALVDVYLTTQEIADMFRRACVSLFTALDSWKSFGDGLFDDSPIRLDQTEENTIRIEGLKNAETLIEQMAAGNISEGHYEVMVCEGGCANGGGQPRKSGSVRNFTDYTKMRRNAMTNQ